jgi:hypothetical protein
MRGAQLPPRYARSVGLVWLAMVGVDFSLHAGVLAPLYDWQSPFLLAPGEAFTRIPIGYLSFLILGAALVWLSARLGVRRAREGAVVGATFGAVIWGAFLLGLWSISTADPKLLLGWWLGQTVELGIGGAVAGAALGGLSLRGIAARVAILLVGTVILAIALQIVGYASPPALAG